MLRSLVLILLLVNATFFAWSQGWLNRVVGVQPESQHEPQRLALQIQPDKLVLVRPAPTTAPASAASSARLQAEAPTAKPTTLCIEAGPFTATEYPQVETTLKPLLPANSWRSDTVAVQGLWMVYMGPYGDADTLARKQTELKRIKGLSFEEVRTPAPLAAGLSLGRFTSLNDATTALNNFKLRGIRTARVVNLRAPMELQLVRVAQASEAMQGALAGVKLPQGKGFTACRP
jgi:hypothetical protein